MLLAYNIRHTLSVTICWILYLAVFRLRSRSFPSQKGTWLPSFCEYNYHLSYL